MSFRGQIDEVRFGPRADAYPTKEQIDEAVAGIIAGAQRHRSSQMHYRNGREAKNGDKIVMIGSKFNADGTQKHGVVTAVGVLYDATPGNDFCNGSIAPIQQQITGACICDCLHVDDLATMLKENGLDVRRSTVGGVA